MRYVVDIGASEGLFANYVAKISKNRSSDPIKVFALEPIPEVAARIKRRENIVTVCLLQFCLSIIFHLPAQFG